MTAFAKTFLFIDNPSGQENIADMKAAGFQGVFCNIVDHAPTSFERNILPRCRELGLFCGTWGRTGHPPPQGIGFEEAKLDKIIAQADKWGGPLVVNLEKEGDGSGDVITKLIAQKVGTRDAAISMEAWPFGNVDWTPVAHLPVLPQIFPQDWWHDGQWSAAQVEQRAFQSKAEWHRRGIKCVWFTFGSYGIQKPSDFTLQAPYSLFTADAIGAPNYGKWSPTSSGFQGCVEAPEPPPPPAKKPVKEYRAEIEALAKECIALWSQGPETRMDVIRREASTALTDKEWRDLQVGKAIRLILDQAEAHE